MKYIMSVCAIVGLLIGQPAMCVEKEQLPQQGEQQPAAEEQQLSEEELQYMMMAKQIWDSLDRRQGEVKLADGVATLNVPENFYYLSPEDAEKILVQAWGNLPGTGQDTLGMLLPTEASPFRGFMGGNDLVRGGRLCIRRGCGRPRLCRAVIADENRYPRSQCRAGKTRL